MPVANNCNGEVFCRTSRNPSSHTCLSFCHTWHRCYNAAVNFVYPLIVVLLAIFAIAPLEYPGAFQSHSGLLAVYNLIRLDQNPLQSVAWAPLVGKEFDWLRIDGAFAYWLAEILHLSGLAYLDAIKAVYAFAWAASGLGMYTLARRFLSQPAALLAATVYLYLPWHIATVYVRGAFGEAVAFALYPLAMNAILNWRSLATSRWAAVRTVLLITILELTQPGMAMLLVIGCLGGLVLLHRQDRRALLPSVATVLGGLGLGLLFMLPVLSQHAFSIASDGFTPNFVMPFQLFSALWGYGPSRGNFLDQFPLQLGIVPVGLAIVAVCLTMQLKPPEQPGSQARVLARSAFVIAFGVTLLTFEVFAPAWSILGLFVSYPWQLLAFAGLALALVSGSTIDLDGRLAQPAMVAALVCLPVIATSGYLAQRPLDVSPQRPEIAIFGSNEIALLDYRIVGPLRHGATLRLQLQWQALRQPDHDYTVFVHAVNEDGETYAREDAKPVDGALPTIQWTMGQVISDTHTIQIDVDGPREGYRLEVGLYEAANGRRAMTNLGTDQLLLPRPGDPEPIISEQIPLAGYQIPLAQTR